MFSFVSSSLCPRFFIILFVFYFLILFYYLLMYKIPFITIWSNILCRLVYERCSVRIILVSLIPPKVGDDVHQNNENIVLCLCLVSSVLIWYKFILLYLKFYSVSSLFLPGKVLMCSQLCRPSILLMFIRIVLSKFLDRRFRFLFCLFTS